MTASATVRRLEEELARREDGPGWRRRIGSPSVLSTGIHRLDGLLPHGGLPRGRAVQWWGVRSCGKTALLRGALIERCGAGDSVAWVDARRTLYAPDWTPLVETGGRFWAVRPPEVREASWCADLLLRSGAFDAVVLEGGAGALSRSTAVRLQRLAGESGSALLVVGEVPVAALRLRFRPARIEPLRPSPFGPFLPRLRPVWVRVEKGRSEEIPVLCPLPPDRSFPSPARDRKGRR